MKTFIQTILVCITLATTSVAHAGTTKVIGKYGKYDVYDMKNEDLSGDFPYDVDDVFQMDQITLAKKLKPVDPADIGKNGIKCDFLCENPSHQVIGYDAKIAIELAKLLKKVPPGAQDAYKAEQDKMLLAQAKLAAPVKSTEIPLIRRDQGPPPSNLAPYPKDVKVVKGKTDSDVPVDIIHWGIDQGAYYGYMATEWVEENAYTQKDRDTGETVHKIEYRAKFFITPDCWPYLGSTFRMTRYSEHGVVTFVLRGKKWYYLSRTKFDS